MLGSTNPGAALAVEQRPQPLEQSWKKAARCVLIPVPHRGMLDEATKQREAA